MRYLLGTLSEEERAQLEERYFSDDALFEEMEIAEEELIDKYVRKELSETDADRFATTVARSSRIAERVEFGRMWKDKLGSMSLDQPVVKAPVKRRETGRGSVSWWNKLSSEPGTPRVAYAMVVLILVVSAIALLWGWLRVREQSRQLAVKQAELEQRQREVSKQEADLKNELEQLARRSSQPTPTETPKPNEAPTPEGGPAVAALILSPGATRGGGSDNSIRISAGTQHVRITLNVSDTEYSSYQAIVQTPERTTVFASGSLKLNRAGSRAFLVLNIPANKLPPGDYPVILSGRTPAGSTEPVHDYRFRVIR